jgi:HlyD family secretion protein
MTLRAKIGGKRVLIGIGLVITILFISVITIYRISGKKANENYIRTVGIIESQEVNLSSEVSGRIEQLFYQEGDTVETGDVVIKLESAEIEARVKEARANLKNAKAELKKAQANVQISRASIDEVNAEIEKAKADLKDAKRNLERANTLWEDTVISERDYDEIKTRHDMASAQLRSWEANLDVTEAKYRFSLAELQSAKARVEEAQANLAVYEAQLDYTLIRTPISGMVVNKTLEAGEWASPGVTILTIHDLARIWARIDLEETNLGEVKLGDAASVRVSSLPDREFEGRVIEIGIQGEFATQRDVKRGRQDIRTFRLRILILHPEGLLRSGMTAEVTIRSEVERS